MSSCFQLTWQVSQFQFYKTIGTMKNQHRNGNCDKNCPVIVKFHQSTEAHFNV